MWNLYLKLRKKGKGGRRREKEKEGEGGRRREKKGEPLANPLPAQSLSDSHVPGLVTLGLGDSWAW
jgi:hypothetical protein